MAKVIPQNSRKAAIIGWAASWLIRLVSLTLRYEFSDPHGIRKLGADERLIWIFWHNRIFLAPMVYRRYLRHRRIHVLTSASRDGALIAQTVGRCGAQAVAELVSCLKSGNDIGITPDGPRGPCYKLAPGPVKLAQLTQTAMISINVNFEKAWKLKSWDQFRIPKPFSKVRIEFGAPLRIAGDVELETARLQAEQYLMQGVDKE